MGSRPRVIQVICLTLAVACFVAAGLMQFVVRRVSANTGLITPRTEAALKNNPQVAFLTTVPGGLRSLALNYLWIRAQEAHEAGRHYDAYQLAQAITQLQPYQDGVWDFQAWNMAWNISVTCKTAPERWTWIYNAVKLLRDKGIPLNPHSLKLYSQLSWIFLMKIGGQIDDMQMQYKERWAWEMQQLLGAPKPVLDTHLSLEEAAQRSIEDFAPIANAPRDPDPLRQGDVLIQPDMRDRLLARLRKAPAVADYLDQLAAAGIQIDESFLHAYNRYSRNPTVAGYRLLRPRPTEGNAEKVYDLINRDEQADSLRPGTTTRTLTPIAQAREDILAFLRSQILWNKYHMDPMFMYALMKRYGMPLDWRHAMSHALYWARLGLDRCGGPNASTFLILNTSRYVLTALKTLTSTGTIAVHENPRSSPDYPSYDEWPDLRFIAPTQKEYLHLIAVDMANEAKESPGSPASKFPTNLLGGGHVNYLADCITLLVADGQITEADKYFQWVKKNYQKTDADWAFTRVEDFVNHELSKETKQRYVTVLSLMTFSLKRALVARGIYGDAETFRQRYDFARRVYQTYQAKAVKRLKLEPSSLVPFRDLFANFLGNLLVRPETFGLNLSVSDRSHIYLSMDDAPQVQVVTYYRFGGAIAAICQQAGVDMRSFFPPPPGLAQYAAEQEKTSQTRPSGREPPNK